jgi:ATP-dependent DNA ligase
VAKRHPHIGVTLNTHTHDEAATVFMGLEGIVSKPLEAPYGSGPSRDCIKVKNPESAAMIRHREGVDSAPICPWRV